MGKEEFYKELWEEYIIANGDMVIMGDFNGHVGRESDGVERVFGAFGISIKSRQGDRLIDFCVLNDRSIMNTLLEHISRSATGETRRDINTH